jgi:hypothetical protein
MRWTGLVAVLMGAAMLPAFAQDAAKVDPGHYKVEIENDQVRVLRMKRGGHDSVPMHEHPASVVVFLTDVREKVTGGDGKVTEVSKKAGDVAFNAPTKHAEEGLSDTPSEVVLVELKAPAHSPVLTDDIVTVDPKHAKVEIDNDRVRVIRVHRGAHEASAMHSHPEDVVIFMTDIHQTVTPKGGEPHEVNRKRGEVSINPKFSTHEETNLKDGPMESILVELK